MRGRYFSLGCLEDSISTANITGRLTLKQMQVLIGVANNQGYSMTELSEMLNLQIGYVTTVVSRLGSQQYNGWDQKNNRKITLKGLGLIQKVKDTGDRRLRCLYLTKRGLRFVKKMLGNS